jgi:hypothetical protein
LLIGELQVRRVGEEEGSDVPRWSAGGTHAATKGRPTREGRRAEGTAAAIAIRTGTRALLRGLSVHRRREREHEEER